jgi:small GTP-binding protein
MMMKVLRKARSRSHNTTPVLDEKPVQAQVQEEEERRISEQEEEEGWWVLSDEVTFMILCLLEARDLCELGTTAHRWHQLTTDDLLWKALNKRDWGIIPKRSTLKKRYKTYKAYYIIQYTYFIDNRIPPNVNPYTPTSIALPLPVSPSFIKVVLVGNLSAGKTDLLLPFDAQPWVGVMTVHIAGHRLDIWDTSGMEEYDKLRPLNYNQTEIIILLFSLVDRESFTAIKQKWLPEAKRFCPRAPRLLVGTYAEKRVNARTRKQLAANGLTPVSSDEGLKLAEKIGVPYIECSARTGENVKEIFELAIHTVFATPAKKTKK